MIYETHNDNEIDASGTHLQGYILCHYTDLVAAFGAHEPGSDKTDAEWVIRFEDGLIGTIYNWKNGQNYNGRHGTPITAIRDWNIGGMKKEVVQRIHDAVHHARARVAA
jgi:hypothetical protein